MSNLEFKGFGIYHNTIVIFQMGVQIFVRIILFFCTMKRHKRFILNQYFPSEIFYFDLSLNNRSRDIAIFLSKRRLFSVALSQISHTHQIKYEDTIPNISGWEGFIKCYDLSLLPLITQNQTDNISYTVSVQLAWLELRSIWRLTLNRKDRSIFKSVRKH